MPPARSPRRVKSARERIALRRAATSSRQRLQNRTSGGCSSIVVGLVAVLLLASVVLAGVAHVSKRALGGFEIDDPRAEANQTTSDRDPQATALPYALPDTMREPFTVLLLGVDLREDEEDFSVRSDTLIVVYVNPAEQWASMLSIPRDSIVDIPNLSKQKINVAYTYGFENADALYGQNTDPIEAGGALAAETVEAFLRLRIDYIAQVDFFGFEKIVDTVGGITLDLSQPLIDAEYPTENYGFERLYIPAGLQVMDGQTALRYARSRHSASDFDRSCRQQRVLRALLRALRQRGLLEQIELLPEIVDDMQDSVATTMPVSDLNVMYGLADLARHLDPDSIVQLSINPDTVRVVAERGSDIYWNEDDIDVLVERLLAGPSEAVEAPEIAQVQVQNGTNVPGLATRVTEHLGEQGFTMSEANDAPQLYEQTLIIDYTDRPETRQRLANLLGVEAQYVYATPPADAPPLPPDSDIVIILGSDHQERWSTLQENTPSAPSPALLPTTPPSPSPPTTPEFQLEGCPTEF